MNDRPSSRAQMHGTSQSGFTMVELLVVIAIVSILAVVAIPQLLGSREKAWRAACDDDYKALAGELQNELDREVSNGNTTAAADVLAAVVPRHSEVNPRNRAEIVYVNNGACAPFLAPASTTCQVFLCYAGSNVIESQQYEAGAIRTHQIAVQ